MKVVQLMVEKEMLIDECGHINAAQEASLWAKGPEVCSAGSTTNAVLVAVRLEYGSTVLQ